ESKIALTTPSTSRCVRSGKSVHSCCTSSERIIGVPASGGSAPTPPRTREPLGIQAVRKVFRTQAGFTRRPLKERRVYRDLGLLLLYRLRRLGGLRFLESGTEDVAERCAGVRGPILRDRLLLLGDLERLDREIRLLRAIEADHHGIELLADLETLGALLVSVAAKIAALDEAGRAIVANLDVEARILNRTHSDGERFAFLDTSSPGHAATCGAPGRSASSAALELLDAEADPLLLDVDVEHLRLDRLTLAVELQRLLARDSPGNVGHVDHAVDVALEADEQAELGRIL